MKCCTRCGVSKEPDAFHRNATRRDGLSAWCKGCTAEANDTPEQRERWRRRRLLRFGITPEEYDELVAAQDGRCAACGAVETAMGNHGSVKALAVDHDHVTGQVRGLLCQACNTALGQLADDPDRIVALLAYALRAASLPSVAPG